MPSGEIILERSFLTGLIFTSVLYGVNLAFYYLSFRLLWKRARTKHRKFYIIYSSLLLVFSTISLATNGAFADLVWIDDRNIPGGPPAYFANNLSAWYNILGTATDITVYAMADGLLLYRCFMFWRDNCWVVALPALIYVSSVAMSIMMTLESALPSANLFQGLPTTFGIPWVVLTVTFNIIVTLMIIGRLLVTYWTIRKSLSPSFSTTYINVTATLVESALPYSALGIGYLILQCMNSDVVIAFALVWGTVAALSPQFIIYRIALGTAWSKDTMSTTCQLEDIRFVSNPTGTSGPGFNLDNHEGRIGSSRLGGSTFEVSTSTDFRLHKEESV